MVKKSLMTCEGFQIRFDGPPSQESGRFIEVEDLSGKGISIGEWKQDGNYWLLIIHNYIPDWLFRDLLDWDVDGLTIQATQRIRDLLDKEAKRRNFKGRDSAYLDYEPKETR